MDPCDVSIIYILIWGVGEQSNNNFRKGLLTS
jgi:hypothetical protein